MKIRPAAVADLIAINDIYNHYVKHATCTYQLEPSTAAERLAWFNCHGLRMPVTVALDPSTEEVIGWASLSPFHPRAAYRFTVEDSVYVHHAHHRRGIGKALLCDLIGRALDLDYRVIVGIVSADQTASVALHKSAGFVEAGVLKGVGYKFDRWLDVLYLQWTRPGHG
jgi:phosphinothricin acetyltransferase